MNMVERLRECNRNCSVWFETLNDIYICSNYHLGPALFIKQLVLKTADLINADRTAQKQFPGTPIAKAGAHR